MALDFEFTGRSKKDVAKLAFELIAQLYMRGIINFGDLKDIAARVPGFTVTEAR